MTSSPDRSLPRYAPEVPFPRHAYVPGRTARPDAVEHGGTSPHSPRPPHSAPSHPGAERVRLASSVGFRRGVDLFNHGYYWEAHEAWEEMWLPIPRDGPESALLQGLIQAAAALLKLRTGAAGPARTIWARGRARLERIAEMAPERRLLGVPIDSVLTALDRAVEEGSLPGPPPVIRLE